MQQQMQQMMPQMLQQMQNPSVQQLMGNPEALQAIMQIQQGMERLRTAAPEVFQSMGFPQLPPNLVPPPAAAPPTSTAGATSPSSAPAGSPAPAAAAAAPAPGQPQDAMFSQFMTQMLGQMRAGNPE